MLTIDLAAFLHNHDHDHDPKHDHLVQLDVYVSEYSSNHQMTLMYLKQKYLLINV